MKMEVSVDHLPSLLHKALASIPSSAKETKGKLIPTLRIFFNGLHQFI